MEFAPRLSGRYSVIFMPWNFYRFTKFYRAHNMEGTHCRYHIFFASESVFCPLLAPSQSTSKGGIVVVYLTLISTLSIIYQFHFVMVNVELHLVSCCAIFECLICHSQGKRRTMMPSHSKRPPWSFPGPVPRRGSQGRYSSPPPRRGQHLQLDQRLHPPTMLHGCNNHGCRLPPVNNNNG